MLVAPHLSAEQLAERRRAGAAVGHQPLPAVPPVLAGAARALRGHPQRGAAPHGLRARGADGS